MIFSMNAIPNWMTIIRILIAPIVAVLIWTDSAPMGYVWALGLYTIASVTDFIDGYVARRLKVVSPFGEMLDPIAGLREFLAKRSFSAPVTVLAKWKTTFQILALGFLIGAPGFPGFPFAHEIGLVLLWAAAIMTIQTGYGYVSGAIRHVTK